MSFKEENPNDASNIKLEVVDSTNTCVVCQKQFSSDRRLQSHVIKKHFVRNDQNTVRAYQCDKCEKSYTTAANLNIHRLTHSGAVKV